MAVGDSASSMQACVGNAATGVQEHTVMSHVMRCCVCRCYLFAGCRQKLLDSLLGASSIQLFMPKVTSISLVTLNIVRQQKV